LSVHRYTLLADGSSDKVLLKVVDWLLRQREVYPEAQFASPESASLGDRLPKALKEFPCDLLIVHRDAENSPLEERRKEIEEACNSLESPPTVCLVPVRMTEAWFLFDEESLRRAAGNPNGNMPLELPRLRVAEKLPNPKEILYGALRTASGTQRRKRKKFNPQRAFHRLAALIDDFSPLEELPAFQLFRDELYRRLEEKSRT